MAASNTAKKDTLNAIVWTAFSVPLKLRIIGIRISYRLVYPPSTGRIKPLT